MSKRDKHDFGVGARIYAAVKSEMLGITGVDYFLKRYVHEDQLHPSWQKVGEHLLRCLVEGIGRLTSSCSQIPIKRHC